MTDARGDPLAAAWSAGRGRPAHRPRRSNVLAGSGGRGRLPARAGDGHHARRARGAGAARPGQGAPSRGPPGAPVGLARRSGGPGPRRPDGGRRGPATMSGVARPALPLGGREAERGLLLEARAAAGRGEPGAVVVEGDAGVGKTRLLTELAERARARGAQVLLGHCSDLGGVGLPYLPFTEALRPLAGAGA